MSATKAFLPQLVISGGDLDGTTVPLKRDQSLTIGRRKESDIHIQDPAVFPSHAEISMENESWVLRNLGRRELVVNGRSVPNQHILTEGDVIVVGPSRLEVRLSGSSAIDRRVSEKEGDRSASLRTSLIYALILLTSLFLGAQMFGGKGSDSGDGSSLKLKNNTIIWGGDKIEFRQAEEAERLYRACLLYTLGKEDEARAMSRDILADIWSGDWQDQQEEVKEWISYIFK